MCMECPMRLAPCRSLRALQPSIHLVHHLLAHLFSASVNKLSPPPLPQPLSTRHVHALLNHRSRPS